MSNIIYALLCFIGFVAILDLTYTIDHRNSNHPSPQQLQAFQNDNKYDQVSISKFEELLKNVIEFSKSRVDSRKRLLQSINRPELYYDLFGSLAPEVFCPLKIRVGKLGDGGKWLCNPWKIPNNSYVLSLGLNTHVDFEEDLQKLLNNRCIVHGYDRDEQNYATKRIYEEIRGVLHTALIGNDTKIETLAKQENIPSFEILKIDIEGAEHDVLISFLENMPVCQICLEIHGTAPKHAELLQKIAHLNYRLFSYEVNGYSITAVEYSFIHEKCVEKYGGYRLANYLDFKN